MMTKQKVCGRYSRPLVGSRKYSQYRLQPDETHIRAIRVYSDRTRQRQNDGVSIVYFVLIDAASLNAPIDKHVFQFQRVEFCAVNLTLTRPVCIDHKAQRKRTSKNAKHKTKLFFSFVCVTPKR